MRIFITSFITEIGGHEKSWGRRNSEEISCSRLFQDVYEDNAKKEIVKDY